MLYRIKKVTMGPLIFGMSIGLVIGCDSGDKAIDEATGNRAFKQYEMSKDKLSTIDKKQKDNLQNVTEDRASEKK